MTIYDLILPMIFLSSCLVILAILIILLFCTTLKYIKMTSIYKIQTKNPPDSPTLQSEIICEKNEILDNFKKNSSETISSEPTLEEASIEEAVIEDDILLHSSIFM